MKYQDCIYHNFYNVLLNIEIESNELKLKTTDNKFKEDLFFVCEKIALIGINAPKFRVAGSTNVEASFQYNDIDGAVHTLISFVSKHNISDIEELFGIIERVHMFAVSEQNAKKVHATLYNEDSSYRLGAYHTFSQLPDDIWDKFKIYTKQCIQDGIHPNSAKSALFAND